MKIPLILFTITLFVLPIRPMQRPSLDTKQSINDKSELINQIHALSNSLGSHVRYDTTALQNKSTKDLLIIIKVLEVATQTAYQDFHIKT